MTKYENFKSNLCKIIEEFNELDRIYTVLDKFRIADNKKSQINLDFS